MTFFNKKEEVLEVQLTRLGRQLLSQGRFKPASYEFMDEDVIYDRQYVMSGSVEEQNEIKTRIKSKLTLRTPTAKQEVKNSQTLEAEAIQIFLQNLLGESGINFPPVFRSENKPIEGLGTFTPYSNYRPAWKIVAEDGSLFTGSSEMSFAPLELKGGTIGPSYEKIPQLDLVCTYNYNRFSFNKNNIESSYYSDVQENLNIDFNDLFKQEDDNTFILFDKNFNDFTILVEEENVLSGKDDFYIEVFKYQYADNFQTASLGQLYFDEEELNPTSVNWYFNISTDVGANTTKEGFTFVDEPVDLEKVDDECVDL
tara:strand:+ start:5600 stop:6535 length:936 start_codon:yes stop_codon:yes gene_type:complete